MLLLGINQRFFILCSVDDIFLGQTIDYNILSILRLDELQKQLQEDIRQGRGIKSPIRIGDQDSTDDEDGLLEEHRYPVFHSVYLLSLYILKLVFVK